MRAPNRKGKASKTSVKSGYVTRNNTGRKRGSARVKSKGRRGRY